VRRAEEMGRRGAMIYVGLTDHPDGRRQEHGDPLDWRQVGPFPNQRAARTWQRATLAHLGDFGRAGRVEDEWRYGYVYTIRSITHE